MAPQKRVSRVGLTCDGLEKPNGYLRFSQANVVNITTAARLAVKVAHGQNGLKLMGGPTASRSIVSKQSWVG